MENYTLKLKRGKINRIYCTILPNDVVLFPISGGAFMEWLYMYRKNIENGKKT